MKYVGLRVREIEKDYINGTEYQVQTIDIKIKDSKKSRYEDAGFIRLQSDSDKKEFYSFDFGINASSADDIKRLNYFVELLQKKQDEIREQENEYIDYIEVLDRMLAEGRAKFVEYDNREYEYKEVDDMLDSSYYRYIGRDRSHQAIVSTITDEGKEQALKELIEQAENMLENQNLLDDRKEELEYYIENPKAEKLDKDTDRHNFEKIDNLKDKNLTEYLQAVK